MIFKTRHPHLQGEGSQGSGSASSQGDSDSSAAKKPDDDKDKDKAKETTEKDKVKALPKDQPITPEILQGVLGHKDRAQKEALRAAIKEMDERFDVRLAELTKTLTAEKKAAKAAKDDAGSEVAELRREVDELKKEKQKLAAALEDSDTMSRQYRFETEVKAALSRHGCRRPDQAFRVLAPQLTHDKEDGRIFAVVDGEYGREELDLDTFIKREARENEIPEFFQPLVRAGSAAGGDAGEGGGQYKFTKEQVEDPDFYVEHADEVRAAIEQGLVKGYTKKSHQKTKT